MKLQRNYKELQSEANAEDVAVLFYDYARVFTVQYVRVRQSNLGLK